MKNLILLLLFFTSFTINAQSEIVQTQKDEFTGETSSFNSAKYGFNPNALFVFYYAEKENLLALRVNVRSPQQFNYTLEGADFYLKMENEKVIKLQAVGQENVQQYIIEATYLLSIEDLETLSKSKVEKCRMSTYKGYLEFSDRKNKGRNSLLLAAKNMINIINQ